MRDELEDEWNKNYRELKDFFLKNGHTLLPVRTRLGRWCSTQRKNFKDGTLLKKREILLNKINFSWDPQDEEWNMKFNELKNSLKKDSKFKPKHDSAMSEWIRGQKRLSRKGTLLKERFDLLNSIGFKWD